MIPWPLLLNRYTAGAAALALVAAGAWWYRGELIQTGYDQAEKDLKAHYAEVARKADAGYRARERVHTEDLANISQRTADETRALAATVAGLTRSLSNRPNRPPGGGDVPTGGAGPVACTGAQLYRPDAEFLVWESARANQLRINLADCQARYDSAVRLTN